MMDMCRRQSFLCMKVEHITNSGNGHVEITIAKKIISVVLGRFLKAAEKKGV